jgi:ABC-type glycerol-3-phosphate transport system substrate-binding protein
MKMFKRFAAALLAGVMVLAMLTACGGTSSAPVAHVTRDEALEKSVAEWTVEWGKSKNLELTVDDSLTAMSDKCLPAMVKIYDATLAKDQNASIAAQNELKNAFVAATNGKKVAPVDVFIPNTMEFTKENVMNVVQNGMGNIQTILTKAGVNNPTKFGVTVTKQKDYTLIFFMISE